MDESVLVQELESLLREQQRSEAEIATVHRAYEYAAQQHDGQVRKNNDKYITHPISVAIILAQIFVDTDTVCAALLHDVLEDTSATSEVLTTMFGGEVCMLVEGVTKLGKIHYESKLQQNAENYRKMFLAMANDVRVVLLKLADRLHNMRTLEYMKREKQIKKATETLEVFAPLANRMGLGKWRAELEDLSFKYLDPDQYDALTNQVAHEKEAWDKSVAAMIDTLKSILLDHHIEAKVYGRVKNYFSLYRKMRSQDKELHDVYDLGALRILVDNEKECYEALGIVHSRFKPIPGRFKDYIAMPKSNLYQSLHTTVISNTGRPIEVQIRTQEMHRVAEYGIAAHWHYKQQGESSAAKVQDDNEQKLTWLKQLIELKEESGDAQEYFENVKFDLFQDEVFVFTPKGDVFDLPRGSTPVDFAYRVHTEVGNTCTGSMVNGKIVPLNYELRNGDIIEIMTSKKASPKVDWIKFVQTQHARVSIRQWYKKNFRQDHIVQGRALLEAELTKAGYEEAVREGRLQEVAEQLNYTKVEDMLLALGYGELTAPKVLNRLRREETAKLTPQTTNLEVLAQRTNILRRRSKGRHGEQIEGLEGMLYHMAKCCNPLPGDDIIGVVTRSRGVMVHRGDCLNLEHVSLDRKMKVRWTYDAIDNKDHLRSVRLEVHVIDRIGIFKDILIRIADKNTNVSNARVKKIMPDNTALLEITVDIMDLNHLDRVKAVVENLSDVISVKRAQTRPGRQQQAGGQRDLTD